MVQNASIPLMGALLLLFKNAQKLEVYGQYGKIPALLWINRSIVFGIEFVGRKNS
jgi:hypothetical protein